ncbi:MAG: hypothetical protein HQK54_13660 [Oligoflexales bacterium]|nr:hypothetical protein [Oligoflexales bacterium]
MMFLRKTRFVAIAIFVTSVLFGCTEKKKIDESGLTFNHDDLFTFSGQQQENLILRSTPVCSPLLVAQKGSLMTAKDGLFKLKFYKVGYESLLEKVKGSFEGDVTSVKEIDKEMAISKDAVESGSIGITPNFTSGNALADGHYIAILCERDKTCIPPSIETLTAYKNKFQDGECGKASDGKLKASCKELILGDEKSNFIGVTYPVSVKDKKFTQGDFDFVYLFSKNQNSINPCGNELALDNVIFESSPGDPSVEGASQPSDPSQVGSTTTPRSQEIGPDGVSAGLPATGDINPGSFGNTDGIPPIPTPVMPPQLPPIPPIPPMPPMMPPMMNMVGECFSKGTKIIVVSVDSKGKITDFGQKDVEEVVEGDYIFEPVRNTAYRVYEKTTDIQTVALYRIDIKGKDGKNISLTVSSAHPVLTDFGLTQVSNIQEGYSVLYASDSYLARTGKLTWKKVERLTRLGKRAVQMRAGDDKGERVYNFRLEAISGKTEKATSESGIYAISNRIVTGDLNTQSALENTTQHNFANGFVSEE